MVNQEKRYKHLTEEDREVIQNCLNAGSNFKSIARRIGKDQTTVSKEVKKRAVSLPARNHTGKEESLCPQLQKAPFVCNGCPKSRYCQKERKMYIARTAQKEYKDKLSECRTGIVLSKEYFYEEDRKISEAVKKGQHVYHVIKSQGSRIPISSVYRYINKGYMSCARIDLPRAVKFKPRKKTQEPKLPSKQRAAHGYDKFLGFCAEHGINTWVEMDTVIGRPGGKTLLTFTVTVCNFFFAFLMEDKTALSVKNTVEHLKDKLGRNGLSFGEAFPLVLTDNGPEFNNIAVIENDLEGRHETDLFFCEPYKSCEKPRVEKNHTMLRDILPAGTSFDQLTQDDIDLVCSHINGVIRKGMYGKTSYQVFSSLFSEKLASVLGVSYIPADQVNQSTSLLKK